MPYLIDSDIVIDHLEAVPAVTSLLERLAGDVLMISIITYIEVFQGVERSPQLEAARARFDSFLEGVAILPISIEAAQRCARLRETLRRQGRRVNSRALDLINAAVALEHGLTLVTRNVDDFRDIPGLQLLRPV